MNIRVHYPQTEEGMEALNERFDQMYADAIIMGLNNREDLTLEQKKNILNRIKNSN